jgi:hypothetical protein
VIRLGFNSTPLKDEKGRHIGYFVRNGLDPDSGWIATVNGTPSEPAILTGKFWPMHPNKAHLRRLEALERLQRGEQ